MVSVVQPIYRRPYSIALPAPRIWDVCHGLLAWLVALNIADLITTQAVLMRGGTESNPIMKSVVDNMVHAGLVKGLCLAAVVALCLRTQKPERACLFLGLVNIWYLTVVAWNFSVLYAA